MAKTRYHLSEKGPAPCEAKPGKCPIDGGNAEQYDNLDDAVEGYEKKVRNEMSEKGENTRTSDKKIPTAEAVDSPSHYSAGWSNGAEIIDIAEHLNFNRGNVVKYVARAGRKYSDKELEDLKKALWYLQREVARLEMEKAQREHDIASRLGS